jgi:hypothetical protein
MHRVLRSLTLAAIVTVIGGGAAWALSPDDAIYLTEQGVDDEVIIAKICADGEAWDLSADDLVYLRDQYVDEDVIEALIDPAGAADRYGFVLGDGDRYDDSHPRTAYVYSLGYYYGPIARNYFCDPFFYSYLYCDRFSFGFSYWPTYYADYCFPYYYGYYAYPYFYYPSTSYYYGYNYCGSYYDRYRTRYRDGYTGGNVRWRNWSDRGQLAQGIDRPRGDWRVESPRNRSGGDLNDGDRLRNRTRTRDPIANDNPGRRAGSNRTWIPRTRDDIQRRGNIRGPDELQRPRRMQNGWVRRGETSTDPGQQTSRGARIIRGRESTGDRGRSRTRNPDDFRRGNQPERGESPRGVERRRFDPGRGNGRGEARGWARRDDGSQGRSEPSRAPAERSPPPENGRGDSGRGESSRGDNGHGWGQGNRGGGGHHR